MSMLNQCHSEAEKAIMADKVGVGSLAILRMYTRRGSVLKFINIRILVPRDDQT